MPGKSDSQVKNPLIFKDFGVLGTVKVLFYIKMCP